MSYPDERLRFQEFWKDQVQEFLREKGLLEDRRIRKYDGGHQEHPFVSWHFREKSGRELRWGYFWNGDGNYRILISYAPSPESLWAYLHFDVREQRGHLYTGEGDYAEKTVQLVETPPVRRLVDLADQHGGRLTVEGFVAVLKSILAHFFQPVMTCAS